MRHCFFTARSQGFGRQKLLACWYNQDYGSEEFLNIKAMSVSEIANQLLVLPVDHRAKLAKILADSVDDFVDGRIEDSWNAVVADRIAETESGEGELTESSDVHLEARRRLEEARKISSAR